MPLQESTRVVKEQFGTSPKISNSRRPAELVNFVDSFMATVKPPVWYRFPSTYSAGGMVCFRFAEKTRRFFFCLALVLIIWNCNYFPYSNNKDNGHRTRMGGEERTDERARCDAIRATYWPGWYVILRGLLRTCAVVLSSLCRQGHFHNFATCCLGSHVCGRRLVVVFVFGFVSVVNVDNNCTTTTGGKQKLEIDIIGSSLLLLNGCECSWLALVLRELSKRFLHS